MKIQSSGYSFAFAPPSVDSEEKAIMDRLLAYGITPTGDKTTDKTTLRRIEYEKAKQDNYVSNKYLTVSQAECQKIQDNKKLKRKQNNPEQQAQKSKMVENQTGATTLGQQLYAIIQLKNKKEYKNKDNAA